MREGNLAFKVTWVYGADGPFTTSCTPAGRDINIRRQKRVWCSEEACPCNEVLKRGNTEPPVPVSGDRPSYDANIFREWRFGGGTFHHGRKRNTPIKIRHAKLGKFAFFTSRERQMKEEHRRVIGGFQIGEIKDVGGRALLSRGQTDLS